MKRRQDRSRILREVRESAMALYRSGAIDKATMQEFDSLATGFADELANMPNVGKDEDFARQQTDRRTPGADE